MDYYYPGDASIYAMTNAMAGLWLVLLIPSLALAALAIAAEWKLFEKADEPGWAAIVPFYNSYVLYKITWGNGWFFLLALIPIANFVIFIITMVKLSTAFGKDGAWAVGLIFLNLIFMCIMAFSKDIKYVGVDGNPSGGGSYGNASGAYQQGYQQTGYQQGFQNPYSSSGGQGQPYQQPSAQNPEYYYQRPAPGGPDPSSTPQDIPYAKPSEPSSSSAGTSANKFCQHCGAQLEGSPKFCHKCGKPQQ